MREDRRCACGCGERLLKQAKKWRKGHHRRTATTGAPCTVEGCGRPIEAKGYCHGHFEYRRRTGLEPTAPFLDTPEKRFLAKITETPAGHWIWRGATASGGVYGAMQYAGRVQPAHRVAWLIFRGPIPEGFEVDHLCRKTLCCNPEHLEPVTPQTNTLRSDSPTAMNAAKTHCKRGHEFTPENQAPYAKPGQRICWTCNKEQSRLAYLRRKAARSQVA